MIPQQNPVTTAVGLNYLVKTQETGESTNMHCGLQDRAGNLWFGSTGEGVYRYDGRSFVNFTKNDGLCSNCVWGMVEDKTGNIWFCTDTGICRYDGKTITPVPMLAAGDTEPAPGTYIKNNVYSGMCDRSGKLWFGTEEGVLCYDGQKFTHFLSADSKIKTNGFSLKSVQCMMEDSKGNIWFGSGPLAFEGICMYDGRSLTSYKPGGEKWIRSISEDKKGNIWLGTRNHGVWRYDGSSYSNFTAGQKINQGGTGSVFEDRAGRIWFASLGGPDDKGVFCFDGTSYKNFTTKDGLSNNTVFSITEDKDGILWFGTNNTGLCSYDGKKFTCY